MVGVAFQSKIGKLMTNIFRSGASESRAAYQQRISRMAATSVPLPAAAAQPATYRVMVESSQAFSLPAATRGLRVLSGCAWVSVDGEDWVLRAGETLALPPGLGYAAVISAPSHHCAVLLLTLDAADPEHTALRDAFYMHVARRQQLMEMEAQQV
jgi:hypothetical protein